MVLFLVMKSRKQFFKKMANSGTQSNMPFEGLSAEDIVVLVQCKLCSFPMESAYIHPSVFYDVDISGFFHL